MFREPIDEPEYINPIIPPEDQSAIISSLISDIQDCENDFHALKTMFDKVRDDRDRWFKIAQSMASCLDSSTEASNLLMEYEEAVRGE